MLIDSIAQRYGSLPSQVVRNADTFDLMVLDVAITYQAYEEAKASGKGIPQHLTERMFGGKQNMEDYFYKVTGRTYGDNSANE